ncbi:SelT-like protein, partial [Drosera capensis]
MNNMLENQFPGIHVVLANYPPSPPKRILAKVMPVVQIGAVALFVAGDQIFLGWESSLRRGFIHYGLIDLELFLLFGCLGTSSNPTYRALVLSKSTLMQNRPSLSLHLNNQRFRSTSLKAPH